MCFKITYNSNIPDHVRLFFGEDYNVTGYTFLNAYASPRPCIAKNGQTCGTGIIEYRQANDPTYYYTDLTSQPGLQKTDMTQKFYIQEADCA